MQLSAAALLLPLAVGLHHGCLGASILAVPVDASHWNTMKVLILELVNRGHEVTVLRLSNTYYTDEVSSDFHIETVQLPQHKARSKDEIEQVSLASILQKAFNDEPRFLSAFWNILESIRRISGDYVVGIESTFENSTLLGRLQDAHFDLVLADPFYPGGAILARYLNLPIIQFGRWLPFEDVHFAVAPSPLSFVPVLNSRLTDRMTFSERLQNVFLYILGGILGQVYIYSTYDQLCHRYLKTGETMYDLYKKSDIYLVKMDFVFEFPKPTMPNLVYIGGFQCKPSESLSPELQKFLDDADEGVVIFSLGTLTKTLPAHVATEVAAGLAKIPQRVIWRYVGKKPSMLGNNTMLLEWLPQNDLLGHSKIKAFIAHGGENGLYEAIYHGVPVIGIPLFGDQYENLLRLKVRGAAILLENLKYLTRDQIYNAVKTITEDPSYRYNMKRLSRLHRDTPIHSKELAVFWVEYVVRNKGAQHLRAASTELPTYQYLLVDVSVLCFIVLVFFVYFIWTILKLIIRKIEFFRKKKTD
ncbi:UDP-glucuronosyltransferase 2C1-like [Polypterus senegalus]|nr:UDP-glucuronosyltransferase 2C1-like [Polypterus senegalus]